MELGWVVEVERRCITHFDVQCAVPLFFNPKEVGHTTLKEVVGRIIGIQIIKKFTERLMWFTGMEHNRVANQIDIPAME